jgi:DivIVA domain-containing protein
MSFERGGAFSWPSVSPTDRQAFEVVRRGYNRAQVEEYLDTLEHDVKRLRSRVGKLEAELESARQRAETAHPEHPASQDPYAAGSDYIAEVMRALVHEVERLRAQANEEVERMLSEARADADRIQQDAESRADEVRSLADDALQEARKAADAIQGDAQERAEETLTTADALLNEARQEAGRVLSDLKRRRRSLLNELRRTRKAVVEALSDLDPTIHEQRPADEVVFIQDDDSEERVER